MTVERAAVVAQRIGRVFTARNENAVTALKEVSLSIPQGEVHGLLGPNGAGKTTLVKILSTVLLPTAGRAFVLGHDIVAHPRLVRPSIGIVLGGERGLYTRLSARRNLEYWGALNHLGRREIRRRSGELLERFGLSDRADQRVEEFSRGMKQRLHLARGLMGESKILFLDEPTSGMDPLAAREFRGVVRELRAEGRTLLITTHDMAEAESICDRVTLIDRGRVLVTATPRALREMIPQLHRIEVDGASSAVLNQIRELPGVTRVVTEMHGSTQIDVDDENATATILRLLVDAGLTQLRTYAPNLEDVYLRIVEEPRLEVSS